MMQILFNIAILSVLFMWVYRGTRKEFATTRQLDSVVKNFAIHDQIQLWQLDRWSKIDKQLKNGDFASKQYVSMLIDAKLRELAETKPASDISTAIKTGATIARENIECGSRIVMESLARDGRIAPGAVSQNVIEALNLGEEDYEPAKPSKLPDIIVARNQKAAEQIGDRVLADLMRGMDEKI